MSDCDCVNVMDFGVVRWILVSGTLGSEGGPHYTLVVNLSFRFKLILANPTKGKLNLLFDLSFGFFFHSKKSNY